MGFERYKATLQRAGVVFEPGLTTKEVYQIEARYGFRFPPDYCAFLMYALPISNGFVDWRHTDEASILSKLSRPYEEICFDIEYSHLWLRAWGPRPAQLSDAFAVAKQALDQAPTLIPVSQHRYIPDRPEEVGNPIFSVWQTDVIYYGCDLPEYLENEFARKLAGRKRHITGPIKHISFWSDLEECVGFIYEDDDEVKI